jgi:hypothetical protein
MSHNSKTKPNKWFLMELTPDAPKGHCIHKSPAKHAAADVNTVSLCSDGDPCELLHTVDSVQASCLFKKPAQPALRPLKSELTPPSLALPWTQFSNAMPPSLTNPTSHCFEIG